MKCRLLACKQSAKGLACNLSLQGCLLPLILFFAAAWAGIYKKEGDTMIRACIFDMDGTVANTLASIAGFANEALKQCGYQEIPEANYRTLVGNGADTLMRRMLKTVAGDFSEEQVMQLRDVYDRAYESEPMRLVTEYAGMREVLYTLKRSGIKIGVFSNKPDDMTRQVAARLYPGLFHCVRGQRSGIPLKPSPEGALLLAGELGVDAGECLYIGDTWVDMETGKNAGMETVGVLWGFRDREELVEAGACHIISCPEELLPLAGVCPEKEF